MDPKELRGLVEAYQQIYAPQEEIEEAVKGESSERRKDLAAERRAGIKPLSAKEGERYASHKMAQMAYAKRKRMGEEVEEVDEATNDPIDVDFKMQRLPNNKTPKPTPQDAAAIADALKLRARARDKASKKIDEAVKGADPEMRRAASAERRAGDKRLSPSKGKGYAAHAMQQAAYVDKKTKGKYIPGMTHEEVEQIDEISQKTATSAYAQRRTGEFEGDDASDRVAKTNKLKGRIEKKFGKEAGKHADRAADVKTFGRKDASGRRKQSPQPRIQTSDHENQREFKRELRIRRDRRLRAARGEDTNEQFDIFDIVLEFLQTEGYAETLEEAEWLMANVINEEAIDIILGEAQHARENPEKYEREQAKRTSKREKAMNDPHKGINSPAFAEFMRKQMGR